MSLKEGKISYMFISTCMQTSTILRLPINSHVSYLWYFTPCWDIPLQSHSSSTILKVNSATHCLSSIILLQQDYFWARIYHLVSVHKGISLGTDLSSCGIIYWVLHFIKGEQKALEFLVLYAATRRILGLKSIHFYLDFPLASHKDHIWF